MNDFSKRHDRLTQLVLAALLVGLAGCTATIEQGVGTMESVSLLERLPAGASAVGFVDVAAVVEAVPPEDWSEYEEMAGDEASLRNLERFTEATGLNPREDLRELAFASMTGADADEQLILISADFDEAKLRELAADAETITYEGVDFYRATDVFERLEEVVGPADDDDQAGDVDIDLSTEEEDGYLSILDAETLGMGSETGLRRAVDVAAGRHEALMTDARMSELIVGVRDQGQIWMVAHRDSWQERVDDLDAGGGGMVPAGAMDSIEEITLSLRLGDGMALALAGVTPDDDAAVELSTSLNGLLAMGRMMLSESDPELLAIVDRGIDVTQEERTVRLDARFTAADIEVLRRLAEEQAAER